MRRPRAQFAVLSQLRITIFGCAAAAAATPPPPLSSPMTVRRSRAVSSAWIPLLMLGGSLVVAGCGSSDGAAEPARLQLTVEGYGMIVTPDRQHPCTSSCELALDAGDVALQAVPARGQVFVGWQGNGCSDPLTTQCEVAGGKSRELVARFARAAVDWDSADWFAGDLHTHSDHSSDGSLLRQSFDDQAPGNMPLADIIELAEGLELDYLPFTDHRTHDQHYDPQWESDGVLLITGEEANGSPHATVHGAVDMIDQNASVPGAPGSRVVQESIWLAHSQGANWVTAHPDDGMIDETLGLPLDRADAVGVDMVELWNRASNPEAEIDYAEERWNAGFRFGIAGASDNHFKELWWLGGTPARPGTEVLLSQLSERALLDGLRDGRSSLYSRDQASPRVRIEADFDGDGRYEHQAGDEIIAPLGSRGELRIRVEQGTGCRLLVYAAPGRQAGPIADRILLGDPEADTLTLPLIVLSSPMWYRAEVRSLGLAEPSSLLFGLLIGPYDFENLAQELLAQLRAMTSPIFVSTAPATPLGPFLPPADAGLVDAAEYAHGALDDFAGFPDAAHDRSSDTLHIVAEVHAGAATHIEYSRRAADGSWLPAQRLDSSARARFPRIASSGQHVAVVWQDEAAGQIPRRPAIHMRQSLDGGTSFAPEVIVRELPGRAMHPDAALDAAGAAHIIWQEIAAGQAFDINYRQLSDDGQLSAIRNLSANGKDVVAPGERDARSARYPASVRPAIAVDDDGAVHAVWQDNRFDPDPLWTGQAATGEGTDPDDWQIAYRRADDDSAAIEFLGAADAADRHPDIVVDGQQRVHLSWDSKPLIAAGANLRVLTSARAATAGSFASPADVSAFAGSSARQPRLGLGANGDARLVWFDSRSADWRWRVMYSDYDGERWAEGILLNGPGNNSWPVIAGPAVVFATTRMARRLQRDRSQQIFVTMDAER